MVVDCHSTAWQKLNYYYITIELWQTVIVPIPAGGSQCSCRTTHFGYRPEPTYSPSRLGATAQHRGAVSAGTWDTWGSTERSRTTGQRCFCHSQSLSRRGLWYCQCSRSGGGRSWCQFRQLPAWHQQRQHPLYGIPTLCPAPGCYCSQWGVSSHLQEMVIPVM